MSTANTRALCDHASRLLAEADVSLGADDFDKRQVETLLLQSLDLVLLALRALRGQVPS